METEKVIALMKSLSGQASNISTPEDFNIVHAKSISMMARIYGNTSNQVADLRYLQHHPPFSGGGPGNLPTIKKELTELLDHTILEVEAFGMDKEEVLSSDTNINITQSQNQETKISLSFVVESIQNELTGVQLKEIQSIISDNKIEESDKKQNIIDKLKSFGRDIASNIIANILTNPALFA